MKPLTIEHLIEHSSLTILSYIDVDGYPVSRAMLAPRKQLGLKEFWFTTNTSSNKVACLRKDAQASIYFMDRRFFRAVSLVGTIEVLEDPASKEAIWQEGDTMYYKEGATDPDYCVLKFTAKKGRSYSNFASEDFEIE